MKLTTERLKNMYLYRGCDYSHPHCVCYGKGKDGVFGRFDRRVVPPRMATKHAGRIGDPLGGEGGEPRHRMAIFFIGRLITPLGIMVDEFRPPFTATSIELP